MKKSILISSATIALVVVTFGLVIKIKNNNVIPTNTGSLTIILSPHFDDGVLSLGGLISKRERPLLVATFFTKRPTEVLHREWDKISGFSNSDEAISARTKENENALVPYDAIIKNYDYLDFQYRVKNENDLIRKEIATNIKDLIKNYQGQELFIYGPATFGPNITHPDHQIVHDALMDVWKMHGDKKVHFYIYEDFPYIHHFYSSRIGDLNTFLERKETLKFIEVPIELNKSDLSEKIDSIKKYKSQIMAFNSIGDDIMTWVDIFSRKRCATLEPKDYACEVVHTEP